MMGSDWADTPDKWKAKYQSWSDATFRDHVMERLAALDSQMTAHYAGRDYDIQVLGMVARKLGYTLAQNQPNTLKD
jgi:hypothetical protein